MIGSRFDVICGNPPCDPFSGAGAVFVPPRPRPRPRALTWRRSVELDLRCGVGYCNNMRGAHGLCAHHRRWMYRYGPMGLTAVLLIDLWRAPRCPNCHRSWREVDRELDHDHATNRIRELVCPDCNKILAFARDRPDVLDRSSKYVRHHSNA